MLSRSSSRSSSPSMCNSSTSPRNMLQLFLPKMAELLRQAVERQLNEPPQSTPPVYVLTDRDPCISWRRLTLRVLRLWLAAACQALTLELTVLPDQAETQTEQQPAHPAAVQRVAILARQPLIPSQADRPLSTGECRHEQMQTRGNKHSKWWACRTCRMRWPRREHETMDWSVVEHAEQLQLWSSSCHLQMERSAVVPLPESVHELHKEELQQKGFTGEFLVIGKNKMGQPIEGANVIPSDLDHGIALLCVPGVHDRPIAEQPQPCEVPSVLLHLESCQQVAGCVEHPITGGVLVTHPPSESKVSDESVWSFTSRPYRLSVCLQTGAGDHKDDNIAESEQGPWSVEVDSWLMKGRRKRKALRHTRLVLLSLFTYHLSTAMSWFSLLSECRLPDPPIQTTHVPLSRHMYAEYKHYLQTPLAEQFASWTLDRLADEIFQRLQGMQIVSANGRTNVCDADTKNHLLSSTVGAMTARGYRVASLTYHEEWLKLLPMLHELARRRPDHLQLPYLAISVSCGMTSEHVDHNASFTSIIAVGRFRG
eukprot:6482009-Amphidinium_carterae.1